MTIVAVGRIPKGPERDLVDRYVGRVEQISGRLGIKLNVRELPQSRLGRAPDRVADEASAIEAAIPTGARRIAMDEKGTSIDSNAFAERIRRWRDDAVGDVALVIGGPDGLASQIVESSEMVLAFGRMSWPHQLVRGMLTEQLYRTMTIISGHPYHRV